MTVDSPELVMPEIDWGRDNIPDMNERLAILKNEGKRCVPVRCKGEVAWLVIGFNEIDKCFRDSELAYNFNKLYMDVPGYTLFNTNGVEHKAFKMAILGLISPTMARLRTPDLIAVAADQLIDGFGKGREVEFLAEFALRYTWIIQTKLLGLPVDPEIEDKVRGIVSDMTQINDTARFSWDELRQNAITAKAAFGEMFRSVVEERRKSPGDDLVSAVIKLEINGHKLNDEQVLSTFAMLYDGVIGTSFQIPNVVYAMLREPEIKNMMLANPDKREAAMDELIRLNQVVGMVFRRTEKDTQIGGVTVPANSIVILSIVGANRSESHFNNATQFSLEKRRPSLAFGAGERICPGKHLARQEIKVALDRLLDRLPGLRLVGKPIRTVGNLGRFLEEDMRIAFDDILPAEQVPLRL